MLGGGTSLQRALPPSAVLARHLHGVRTAGARRFRCLCEAFTAELGGQLTEVDQNLIKQAANLVLAAERFQVDVVNGAVVNPDAMVRVSSEARRILGMLGTKAAKNKPTASSLKDYLNSKYGSAPAESRLWRP